MTSSRQGLLVVISGPSGSGKTTIARALEERLGGRFSVSATTRPRSRAEQGGRDYDFIGEAEFERRIERGEFLEHARVFGRDWYGTPRAPVERQLADGSLVILDIDVQGALQVRRSMPDALLVFVLPPSDDELLARLRGRGRDDEESIEIRFREAKREIATATASGAYDATIVNDDLERAVDEACRLVEERRRRPQHA